MQQIQADLIVVAACLYGMDACKHWIFATSWRALQKLQGICPHARDYHPSFVGIQGPDGGYISRATAMFPESRPFQSGPWMTFLQLPVGASTLCPIGPARSLGSMIVLRLCVMSFASFLLRSVFSRLRAHVDAPTSEPLFTSAEVQHMRTLWEAWFQEQGHSEPISWAAAPGQPYSLDALQDLATVLGDKDVSLWPSSWRQR